MLILRLSGYKNQKSASKSPSIFTDPIKKCQIKNRAYQKKNVRCLKNKNVRKGLKNSWQHNPWELKSEKEFINSRKNLSKPRKIHQGQEKPIKIKKIIPRSRKRYHDQEKFIKTKRTSQRYNPKGSGNYQKQIPLPYGTQKTRRTVETGYNKIPWEHYHKVTRKIEKGTDLRRWKWW